jgi:biopolymer transport protein ExbB
MKTLSERFDLLWTQAMELWIAGGWCMIPIALSAWVLFAIGLNVRLKLREKQFMSVREETWREWIEHPERRRGVVGRLLDRTNGCQSLDDVSGAFTELRSLEVAPFERDLRVMKVCISSAPLLGLLGTVTGMLATFNALATGSGGEKTMALVAKGISEALITTMTGLVVALPGLFFLYLLGRKFEQYKAFLAHVETVLAQRVFRRSHQRTEDVAVTN